MTKDDRTRSDGDLAPVTDLFGARSRRASEPTPGPGDAADADGWAQTDVPGDDEIASPDEWRAPVTGQSRVRSAVPIAPDISPSIDVLRAAVTSIESKTSVGSGTSVGSNGSVGSKSGYVGGAMADGAASDDGGAAAGDSAAADDEPESMSIDDTCAEAEKLSMRALSRRGVSTSELRTVLLRHELDDDVIEFEIDRLTRVGLLDDAQLAADLVDRLHDRKGLGKQGVTAELRRRGIDQTAIEQALASEDPDDDAAESERALELAVKRAGQMRGLDRETAERRLSGFLMRKGYNGSVVHSAVRTALDGAGPNGAGPRGGGARGGGSRGGGGVRFQ